MKPSSKPDWTVGNPSFGTVTIEPSSGKKTTGWTAGERPPHQTMNWLFYNVNEWITYFEAATANLGFDAVVGSGPAATHATLALALADVAITAGKKILITEDFVVASTIQITKNNLEIEFRPGVTYSAGAATTGIQVSADGVIIRKGRLTGFTSAGILIDSGSDYTMLRDQRFSGNTNDVVDNASTTDMSGSITE